MTIVERPKVVRVNQKLSMVKRDCPPCDDSTSSMLPMQYHRICVYVCFLLLVSNYNSTRRGILVNFVLCRGILVVL